MHKPTRRLRPAAIVVLLALALAGCSLQQDPFERPGTWHSTGVNDDNLRAMVADPNDLAAGRGTDRALSAEAAPPVKRLLTGNRLPLPTLSSSGYSESAPTDAQPSGGAGNGSQ